MAMAFHGFGKPARPFDPLPEAYSTPGIGDGLPGATPLSSAPRPGMFAARRTPLSLDMADVTEIAASEMGNSQSQALAPVSLIDPSAMPERAGNLPTLSGMPEVKAAKPAFFGKGGVGWDIIGTIGDIAAGLGGAQGTYWPTRLAQKRQQTEWERQDALRRQDRDWVIEDRNYRASLPQYFMSGRDRVSFNPVTGETQTVYDAPEDFQEYANLLGLEPGSDEYNDAMEDYVLRSNGPTAQAGRAELEGIRQNNRVSLEGVRQNNRAALRQMPTYSNLHPRPAGGGSGGGGDRPPRNTSNVFAPILAKVARGLPLTAGEQQVLGMYNRGRGGKGAVNTSAGTGGGKTATDPRTGKKVQWNGSQWVPIN